MNARFSGRSAAPLLVLTTFLLCAPAIALGSAVHHPDAAPKHHAHKRLREPGAAGHSLKANRAATVRHRHPPSTPTTTTTTSTTTLTTDRSGAPMPTANITDWNLLSSDNFSESSLNASVWQSYWGQPGGDPGGWWNTNHLTLGSSILDLRSYKDTSQGAAAGAWATAGVAQRASQTYGKWEVRAKMNNGKGIAPVLLLWPQSNNWPTDGEIDFAEDGGQNPRSTDYMSLHYSGACGSDHDCQTQQTTSVDWSQWHTYGVEWTPGKVVFTLDGKNVGTITSNVPTGPMHLAMQDQMEGSSICGGWEACTDAATPAEVDFDIDWVVDYSPAK